MTDASGVGLEFSRRRVLTTVGAGVGSLGVYPGRSQAQTTTAEEGGQAQIPTKAIVPRVGEPYQGEYVGQFITFTDPTPNEEVSPAIVGECDFADWSPSETRGYQGLLIDRLNDEPRGVEVSMYLNGNKERVEVGNTFIINRVENCSNHFIGVELEDVPVTRFNPDYDTVDNPLVGEEPGPTVSPAPDGETEGPGQPGLGVGTAVVGIGIAGLLGRFLGESSGRDDRDPGRRR